MTCLYSPYSWQDHFLLSCGASWCLHWHVLKKPVVGRLRKGQLVAGRRAWFRQARPGGALPLERLHFACQSAQQHLMLLPRNTGPCPTLVNLSFGSSAIASQELVVLITVWMIAGKKPTIPVRHRNHLVILLCWGCLSGIFAQYTSRIHYHCCKSNSHIVHNSRYQSNNILFLVCQ